MVPQAGRPASLIISILKPEQGRMMTLDRTKPGPLLFAQREGRGFVLQPTTASTVTPSVTYGTPGPKNSKHK